MKPEELLELQTFEELRDEAVQELNNRNFKIKNFRAGRIFYTLLELSMQAVAVLYKLLVKVLYQLFLSTATGQWLQVLALDRSGVIIKQPQETLGVIKAGRTDTSTKAILQVGDIVSTEEDNEGNTLRYFVTAQTILDVGVAEVTVPVKAENGGAKYNVPASYITKLTTFRPGIEYITNDADWITQEGTDLEDEESLRRRAQEKPFSISYGGNKMMYQSKAEEITGVARARVDIKQPRGEGTVDVVIIGTEGVPSQAVLDAVAAKLEDEGSAIADIAVYPIEELPVDISATIYYDSDYGDPILIESQANDVINNTFKVTPVENIKQFNIEYGVDRSLVTSNLRNITNVISVEITAPAADIRPTTNQLAVPGVISLTLIGVDI